MAAGPAGRPVLSLAMLALLAGASSSPAQAMGGYFSERAEFRAARAAYESDMPRWKRELVLPTVDLEERPDQASGHLLAARARRRHWRSVLEAGNPGRLRRRLQAVRRARRDRAPPRSRHRGEVAAVEESCAEPGCQEDDPNAIEILDISCPALHLELPRRR